jgi:hypothetical protein
LEAIGLPKLGGDGTLIELTPNLDKTRPSLMKKQWRNGKGNRMDILGLF